MNHSQDYLLPRSLTLRLAKSVLPPNTTVQKDAVLAMQKAATVFVSYLSSQYVMSTRFSIRPVPPFPDKGHYYDIQFSVRTDQLTV